MMLRAAPTPHLRALNISIGGPTRSPAAYTPGTEVRMWVSAITNPRSSVASPSGAYMDRSGRSPVPTNTKSVSISRTAPPGSR